MIRAVLVDDELKALEVLKQKLTTYCPQVEIIGTASSTSEAYDLITTSHPQLVFLDVAMPNETGFDLLRRLPRLDFELIFVTGFDSFALDAIKFCAIGYVLKPIENEELINSVNHAERRINEKLNHERNQQFLNNFLNPGNTQNRIGIPTEAGLEFVPTEEIVRCEGFQKYTKVITKDRKDILSSYNIGEFRKLLEHYGFYAPHKSHLINLQHIKRYDKEGTVTMSDESFVPVSRRKKHEFMEKLTRV
ncbi:MAG: LytTR family DNA-binding domain-containing protein [Saprospiraceae bacterium]